MESLCLTVFVSGFVWKISSEPLKLLHSNLVGWSIIISWSVVHFFFFNWDAIFKITVRAYKTKNCVYYILLTNSSSARSKHKTVQKYTCLLWYRRTVCCVHCSSATKHSLMVARASQAKVPSENIGWLCSRSRSQQRFRILSVISSYNIGY